MYHREDLGYIAFPNKNILIFNLYAQVLRIIPEQHILVGQPFTNLGYNS